MLRALGLTVNRGCQRIVFTNKRWNLHKLQCTSTRTYKSFLGMENKFAHNVLEQRPIYENLITNSEVTANDRGSAIAVNEFNDLMSQNWREKSKQDVLDGFVKISNYAKTYNLNISDRVFDNLIEGILLKCRDFNYDDILVALQSLIKWPETESLNNRNFADLWSALDDMCMELASNPPYLSTRKHLLLMDCWYYLDLARISDYVFGALSKLSRRLANLTIPEFVQIMFYVNVTRRPLGNMFDFEQHLCNVIDDLTTDEIAIVCMGFFKSKTLFHSIETSSKLMDRLLKDAGNINDISLAAILKMLRYSKRMVPEKLSLLQSQFIPHVNKLSDLCCVHLALLGSTILVCNPVLLDNICQKVTIDQLRIKDLERLTFVMSTFNLWPKMKENGDFYEIIIEQVRTKTEDIRRYPKCLSHICNYLAIQNYYPHDLISKSLDPDFVKEHYKTLRRGVGRDVLVNDCNVEIEQPSYNGNRLLEKWRVNLPKYLTAWAPRKDDQEYTKKQMWQIMGYIEKIRGGAEYMHVDHILPHFDRADIVICNKITEDGVEIPVAIGDSLRRYDLSQVKYPPDSTKLRWYAIVIGARNLYVRNLNEPIGLLNMKLRQLERVGYVPVLIPHFEWDFSVSDEQRMEYLANKLRKFNFVEREKKRVENKS